MCYRLARPASRAASGPPPGPRPQKPPRTALAQRHPSAGTPCRPHTRRRLAARCRSHHTFSSEMRAGPASAPPRRRRSSHRSRTRHGASGSPVWSAPCGLFRATSDPSDCRRTPRRMRPVRTADRTGPAFLQCRQRSYPTQFNLLASQNFPLRPPLGRGGRPRLRRRLSSRARSSWPSPASTPFGAGG